MTLPIIPGPYSFLAGAGQAAGAIGGAITEKQRYEQALQMQQQQQAMQQILLLGKIGLRPEAAADPQYASLFQGANVAQPTVGQIEVPYETQRGRRAGKELQSIQPGSTQSQMASGIPTGAATKVEEAKGARAGLDLKALEDFAKDATPAQLRAIAQLVPKEFADEAEKLALEKLKTQGMQQEEQRSESSVRNNVWNSVRSRLPNDAGFRNIAEYAAIGGLGYLTAGLQLQFGRAGFDTARVKAWADINDRAYGLYAKAFGEWHDKLEAAKKLAHAGDYLEMSPSEKAKVDNDVTAAHIAANGKEPRFEFFKKEALESIGSSEEEWNQTAKEILKITQRGPIGQGNPFEKAKALRKAGKINNAHIEQSFKDGYINEKQRDELKAITPDAAKSDTTKTGRTPDE